MNDNLFKYLVLTKIHTSCSLVWILNSFEHCHPVAHMRGVLYAKILLSQALFFKNLKFIFKFWYSSKLYTKY